MHDHFDDDEIKRGEKVGSAIAFWLVLVLSFPFALKHFAAYSWGMRGLYALLCSVFFGFIMSILGYFWGMDAARCADVKTAFLRGAKIGAISYGCLYLFAQLCPPPLLRMSLLQIRQVSILTFFQLVIFAASGALLSGLTSIYVRDYLVFERPRRIPQFTLQEVFIVFTIVAVIISSITTMMLIQAESVM